MACCTLCPLATIKIFFVCILLLLVTPIRMTSSACNKLNAAFTFKDTFYFIYGDDLMTGFSFNGVETYSGSASQTLGYKKPITAAVVDHGYHMIFLQSGKEEQGFSDFGEMNRVHVQPRFWSRAEEKLRGIPGYSGIDAAFHRGLSNIVYLAGCHYVEVDVNFMSIVQSGSLSDVGIPCHVDAAWSSPNAEYGYIVKGLELYPWSAHFPTASHVLPVYTWFHYLSRLNLCQ